MNMNILVLVLFPFCCVALTVETPNCVYKVRETRDEDAGGPCQGLLLLILIFRGGIVHTR